MCTLSLRRYRVSRAAAYMPTSFPTAFWQPLRSVGGAGQEPGGAYAPENANAPREVSRGVLFQSDLTIGLGLGHVDGLRAFTPGGNVELDSLAFFEALEAVAGDRRVVDEDVFA